MGLDCRDVRIIGGEGFPWGSESGRGGVVLDATGELEDTSGLSEAKKDVARLLTIARQRNIDLEREQGASK